jgi:hypothetical protein
VLCRSTPDESLIRVVQAARRFAETRSRGAGSTSRAEQCPRHDDGVLLRFAYLTVTNTFAVLRLLPMTDRDKDAEILALRHQITVLQRHLSPAAAENGIRPGGSELRAVSIVDSGRTGRPLVQPGSPRHDDLLRCCDLPTWV